MSIEQNKSQKFKEAAQKYFDKFIWYYKKYFSWKYLVYKEENHIPKRITFLGAKNNIENGQVILKLINIKDNKKGYNILKEPYFLACLKKNRYFAEIVDLFPSKDSKDFKFFNIILRNEGSDLNSFIIYYKYVLKIDYNNLFENISRHIIFQVVCGLKILHEKGLSHNNIKPQNIVISGSHKAKICDLCSTDIINTVSNIGTLGYYSPQAMAGKKRTAEDDMYAVGIVFLELLNVEIGIFLEDIPIDDERKQLLHVINKFYDVEYKIYNENTIDNAIYNSILKDKYDDIKFKLKENIFRPDENEENKALIKNLLEIDPSKRMKAEEVINLPLFKDLHYEFENNNTDMKYYNEDYEKYFKNQEEYKENVLKDFIEDIREKFIGKTLFDENPY
jgi:serine/threonine protein kinase